MTIQGIAAGAMLVMIAEAALPVRPRGAQCVCVCVRVRAAADGGRARVLACARTVAQEAYREAGKLQGLATLTGFLAAYFVKLAEG